MNEIEIITAVPVLTLLAIATLIDWRRHRIPNALSFGGALFGFILQASASGFTGAALALSGWAVCLVCFLPFYIKGGMAAGDVKLMAAVGAFLGPIGGLQAAVAALLVGALIAMISIFVDIAMRSPEEGGSAATLRSALSTRIPYAGAIAAGTALIVLKPAFIDNLFQLSHSGVFV